MSENRLAPQPKPPLPMRRKSDAAKNQMWLWIFIGLVIVAVIGVGALIAFVLGSVRGTPRVVIAAPASNTQFNEGQDIVVQSTTTDDLGVIRVTLSVDNIVVQEDRLDPPQKSITRNQTWKALGVGPHTIIARAFRADGTASEPTSIVVTILAQPTPGGGTPVPTSAPAPVTPLPTLIPGCVYNSIRVDETIPDGTVFAAGATFQKSWKILNNGTCPWNQNFKFAFVSGEAMNAPAWVAVPYTPPGALIELLVNQVAPTAPGPHVGHWQILDDNNNPIGVLFDVVINTTNPQPTPVCNGTPVIGNFAANPTVIRPSSKVRLAWDAVGNTSFVKIDPGIGAVTTPGFIDIVVDQTTTFTLTAYCGNNTNAKQVTVTVGQATPTPVPPTAAPQFTVTGATAAASPATFTGTCPAQFTFSGNVTTNGIGTLTYRWAWPGGNSPNLTLYSPSAGAYAIPAYATNFNTKGGLWAQLQIVAPNIVNSNQVGFNNNCADPPVPAPQVSMVAPGNGQHFQQGATFEVKARALGSTELASITLFYRTSLLGSNWTQLAKVPIRTAVRDYTATASWRPEQTGAFELRAEATDIRGQTSQSGAITIHMDAPPTPVPPTATRVPPTNTPVPPTATRVPPTNTPVPPTATHVPPTNTPVPPRRNVTGTWVANEWSVSLTEALGCPGPDCGMIGKLTHGVLPAPQTVDVQGSFNVTTGVVHFAATLLGGQTFSGTVSADSRTMSGTLSGVGALNFTKQ